MPQIIKLRGKERSEFYQCKYLHYKKFNLLALCAFCFAFIILFASDLKLATMVYRLFVLIPMSLFIILYKKTDNYRIMSTLTFLVVHAIIWTGIWIIALNKDMSLANENFLFMGFILLIVSFCTPPGYSFIGQWGLLLNIILANGIYHYNDFDVMMVYNCQIVIMLNIVNIIITKLYYDHYMNEKSLKRLIMIDPLTQVYNRNKLVEINRELTSAHDNVGIIIVDIDHFKNINDTYGHEKGDVILQFVVSHIKKCVRANDSIIRWGGEEFVVIMPNCNLDQTFKIAERVRKDIAESDNGLCPITVSIGVSEYLNRDLQASTKAADDALYKAKEAGRNRVCRNN